MGLTKEEFTDLMIRNEFGKKQTRINKIMNEAKRKENDVTSFRIEGRKDNIQRGNKKKVPTFL